MANSAQNRLDETKDSIDLSVSKYHRVQKQVERLSRLESTASNELATTIRQHSHIVQNLAARPLKAGSAGEIISTQAAGQIKDVYADLDCIKEQLENRTDELNLIRENTVSLVSSFRRISEASDLDSTPDIVANTLEEITQPVRRLDPNKESESAIEAYIKLL